MPSHRQAPPPTKFGLPALQAKPAAAPRGGQPPPPTRFGPAIGSAPAPMQAALRKPTFATSSTALAVKAPANHRVVQPSLLKDFKSAVSHLFGSVTEGTLPTGITKLKALPHGYNIGCSGNHKLVGLYDPTGKLVAHVEIMTHGTSISLHTRTDSGAEGGQGSMTALFPETLKVVAEHFSNYLTIEMAPAPGAATKGLISQLARLRLQVADVGPTNMFSKVRKGMAAKHLATAAKLRTARKADEKAADHKKPKAQAWNSAAMLETAWELNALQELEFASSTGLTIGGTGTQFHEQLVGAGSPALFGGALAWHQSVDEKATGFLNIIIPMASVPAYIAALKSLGA